MNKIEVAVFNSFDKLLLSSLTEDLVTQTTNCYEVGIKYTISGVENYNFNRTEHRVTSNNYALINSNQPYSLRIEKNKNPVLGCCLFLHPNTIKDVYNNLDKNDNFLLDNPVSSNTKNIDFFDGLYSDNDVLGKCLYQLTHKLDNENLKLDIDGREDLFFILSKELLVSQKVIKEEQKNINAKSSITKKEIYRRIIIGRDYIETNFLKDFSLEDVAHAATMSSYHFCRSFKQVFGITPKQYQIKKRLEYAITLLKSELAIEEIAKRSGFSTIFSFSTTFKKYFNVAPSFFWKRK